MHSLYLAFIPLLLAAQSPVNPIPVQLKTTPDGFQLLRDGKPYFIKGAGGDGPLPLLAASGANSMRTWGADPSLKARLDEAHRLGLSVCVGLWLGHERHGFNYNDPDQVARQIEEVKKAVLQYKDHPAVLLWGIGNEMEGPDGSNAAIWSAVNNLAHAVKQLDPLHPTMTVIAELGGQKVESLHKLCPDIDIVGINSYGGAASVPTRYRQAGGKKPYILTEFGPPGRWEIKSTPWGAPPELSSTAKASLYQKIYQSAITAAPGLCLGSYAFIWGHKQEATATWFGLLLPDGARLAATDTLTTLWTGKPPANLCPAIQSLRLDGPDQLDPGTTIRLDLTTSDPENDPLTVQWILQREAAAYGSGGDREPLPQTYPEAILEASPSSATIKLPEAPGGYRVFAYVRDNHQGAATANIPILVKGQETAPLAPSASLPLVVYDESPRDHPPYVPSGWMGNQQALKLDEACAVNPHSGKTCLRIDYQAPDQWAGIVWQDPPNDWGDLPGGHNLKGAKRLHFWARGASGDETVAVELGIYGPDKKFPDSTRVKLDNLRLTTSWKAFSIPLDNRDLSRIKSGFVIIITGSGKPFTLYLDDITYE